MLRNIALKYNNYRGKLSNIQGNYELIRILPSIEILLNRINKGVKKRSIFSKIT